MQEKDKTRVVRLTEENHRALKREMVESGKTMTAIANEIIKEYFDTLDAVGYPATK
jgi:hypothetical protein